MSPRAHLYSGVGDTRLCPASCKQAAGQGRPVRQRTSQNRLGRTAGEAAGEKWLHLRPDKWNPSRPVVYGWRYDPREFAPGAAPARDARRRNATRVMDD